jgi:peroxiredoxin Q/BCP
MFGWLFDRPLPVGSIAPDFTLPDQDGAPVTLSALKGHNVVLIFYPGDDTPTCRKQLTEFRDQAGLRAAKNALVFGINPQDAGHHADFRRKEQLDFPLLVDTNKKIANLYHAGGPIVRRTVYLVGKEGKIRFARRGKPEPGEVLAAAE